LVDIIRSFVPDRVKATLAVFHLGNAVFQSKVPAQCDIVDMGCERTRRSVPAIVRTVWKIRPQIVFATLSHVNLLVGLIRWLFPSDVTCVAQQVGVLSSLIGNGYRKRLLRVLYGVSYRNFDRVVCVSNAVRDDLQATLSLDPRRLQVIYNPCDFVDIDAQLNDEAASAEAERFLDTLPPGSKVLVAAGGLNHNKGFDILIDAVFLCNDTRLQVVVLGEGEARAALERRVRDRGLDQRIHFVGFKSNVYCWLSKADCFVLSSRMEGFGNVMIEAIACGLPVVATPAGGAIKEILDGVGGCIVADEVCAPSLAEAIRQWLAGTPVRMERGAIEKFDIAHISEQYLQALESVAWPGGSHQRSVLRV
jgi:glycosyltransferase involved in cell wall biosynthesis